MNKSILILVIVISVVLLYQFIIKPIQTEKKLEDCLHIPALISGEGTQEQRKEFEDSCYRRYGKN